MVGMVIPRPVRQNDVGPPPADLLDDLMTGIERWRKLSVAIRENLNFGDAEALRRLLGLVLTERGDQRRGMQVMAGFAVGHREELDCMASRCQLRPRPP